MSKITDINAYREVKGNKIIGAPLQFSDSFAEFFGENNVLVFSPNVTLYKSVFSFKGNNSLIYISGSIEPVSLNITVYTDSTIYVGENLATNGTVSIIASEARHVFLGNNCLISKGCSIRTGDAHRLYDITTGARLNEGRSVFMGDHVWLGWGVNVLKGSRLYSGTIVGLGAILTGKEYFSNTAYGANLAKPIAYNVCFDKRGTHGMCDSDKEKISHVDLKQLEGFVFSADESTIDFSKIDEVLTETKDIETRIKYLRSLQNYNKHNRFSKNFIHED